MTLALKQRSPSLPQSEVVRDDGLGPRSLTQSHPVSRSELDFRNSTQLPCVHLADAPLPRPQAISPCKPPPYKKDLWEGVGSCKEEGSWCRCIWTMASFRGTLRMG